MSTKFRPSQQKGESPPNFVRHDDSISQFQNHLEVSAFIGTPEHRSRKAQRFRQNDNLNIAENKTFLFSDPETRQHYTPAFRNTAPLCFGEQTPFDYHFEKDPRADGHTVKIHRIAMVLELPPSTCSSSLVPGYIKYMPPKYFYLQNMKFIAVSPLPTAPIHHSQARSARICHP